MDGLTCYWYRLNVQRATGYLVSLYINMIYLPVVIFVDTCEGCVLPVRVHCTVHCGILEMQS